MSFVINTQASMWSAGNILLLGVFMAAVLWDTAICRLYPCYSTEKIRPRRKEDEENLLPPDMGKATFFRLKDVFASALCLWKCLFTIVYNTCRWEPGAYKNLWRFFFFFYINRSYIRRTTRRARYKSYHPREFDTSDEEDCESGN